MSNVNAGSNVGFTRETFEKDLKSFGKDDGKGRGARVSAFVRGVEAAQRLNIGEKDAKELWTIYSKAASENAGKEFSMGSSFDVQVSKFRQSLVLGAMPDIDGLGVIYRAIDILRAEQAKEDTGVKGSTYDNLVAVARAQIAQPASELSDDQITDTVIKVAKEKTDLDRLNDLYKRAYKTAADLPNNSPAKPYAQDSVTQIGNAIMALDGELPAVTKEEKAKAAVMARAAKLGIPLHTSSVTRDTTGNLVPVSTLIPQAAE